MENGKWTMEMENGSSTNAFAEGKRKKIKNGATDNQKARRKIRKQQEFDIDRG